MFDNLSPLVRSALVRGARTFIQVFGIAIAAGATKAVDIPTLWAVIMGAAGFAAAAAWRAVLDPSPVPSLADPAPTAH